MSAPRHVPVLDGVRGVAILLVLAFHLSWALPATTLVARAIKPVFFKGWVGVDLFFVLSGYLITLGLAAPSTRGIGARMRRFYTRRALRIFPLYYATIAVGSLACLLAGARAPGAPFWLYVQNYVQARDPNVEAWTGHLWSLAVEEQFYLVWPAVVLLLPRRRVAATAALLAAGVAARTGVIFGSGWDLARATHYVYRATFTHADGLLAGALVALVEAAPRTTIARAWTRARVPGLAVALALYLAPRALSSGDDVFARLAECVEPLVLAYGFAVIVSVAVEAVHAPDLTRALEARWLRACGRVSYGMYVLHWPLMVLLLPHLRRVNAALSPARATALELAFVPAAAVAVFVLAQLSYRFLEAPFLRLKERFSE